MGKELVTLSKEHWSSPMAVGACFVLSEIMPQMGHPEPLAVEAGRALGAS